MMALVTLATAGAALVQSGSVGAVTAYHNAPALGVIAGVCSAGISEPTTAWDLEQFGMSEDLIPSQNASDIVFGPKWKRKYSYDARDEHGSIHVVETKYQHHPHEAAKAAGNEWVAIESRPYVIPRMAGRNDKWSLQEATDYMHEWRHNNPHADREHTEVQVPGNAPQFEQAHS